MTGAALSIPSGRIKDKTSQPDSAFQRLQHRVQLIDDRAVFKITVSGVEIAGLVLEALPLVITALEHYRAGKGVLASLIRWRDLLKKLIDHLKDLQTIYSTKIRTLLQISGTDDSHLTDAACTKVSAQKLNKQQDREIPGHSYG